MRGKNTVIVVAGPTASGKSSYALDIAKIRNGIIINADSVQLYNALPILTAQPSKEDLSEVRHTLYGILDPLDKCSAWRWREMVLEEIRESLGRGMTPVVTGGTGFYLKALTEGLSYIPEVPASIRDKVTSLQEEMGNPAFYTELSARDPEMAARLHPNDTQRLIRAWEILEATGKSLGWWQDQPVEGPPEDLVFDVRVLLPLRPVLYQRCNDRFDWMLENGALDEVSALWKKMQEGRWSEDAPITRALGFKPLCDWLRGELAREEAVEQGKAQTRQYAKRQVTWFRNQMKEAEHIKVSTSQGG